MPHCTTMLTIRVDLADDEVVALREETKARALRIIQGAVPMRPQDRAIAKLLGAIEDATAVRSPIAVVKDGTSG
jgi:hypothetical protein